MYLEKSLKIDQKFVGNTESSEIGNTKLNIGSLYKCIGDFDKAFDFLFESLYLFRNINNTSNDININIFYGLYEIGNIFYSLGNYEIALDYFLESLRISKELNMNENKIFTSLCFKIGCSYDKINNYKKAFQFYKKTLDIERNLFGNRDYSSIASTLNSIIDLLVKNFT
jgi:tetratricopeptide (TPR) repeat protein